MVTLDVGLLTNYLTRLIFYRVVQAVKPPAKVFLQILRFAVRIAGREQSVIVECARAAGRRPTKALIAGSSRDELVLYVRVRSKRQ